MRKKCLIWIVNLIKNQYLNRGVSLVQEWRWHQAFFLLFRVWRTASSDLEKEKGAMKYAFSKYLMNILYENCTYKTFKMNFEEI